MSFQIEILPPSPEFKTYISHYKYVQTDLEGIFKIIPNTNPELYFNFKKGKYQSAGKYTLFNPLVHFAGLHLYDQIAYSTIYGREMSGGFVIVFKPDGIQKLFGMCNSEIVGFAIDGQNIFKNHAEYLWHELKNSGNFIEMKLAVERFLIKFINKRVVSDYTLNNVLELICKENGMLSAGQICKEYKISQRSLQRKFKDIIGMSPKEYLQITRLNYAIELIQNNKDHSLTRISYLSGYYDQSHFIKDIKKICGFSPLTLKKEELHLEHCDNRNFLKMS